MSFLLYDKQQDFVNSEHPVMGFVGGIGSGKTVAGSHFAAGNINDNPHIPGLIFANTSKQLHTSTLHVFMLVLHEYGWIRDLHYVVNRRPNYGHPSHFDNHAGIWSFWNGAQVMTFSLESMMRGITVGWAWGDEIQDAALESLHIVTGRVRGADKPLIRYTLTPPRSNPEIDELIFGDKSIPTIQASTYENRHNLPEGYIEMLEQMYDDVTLQREVYAEKVDTSNKAFAYAFKERHVSEKARLNDNLALYLCFDFNVDPFVCVARHHGGKFIHFVDEIVLSGSNVYEMATEIKSRFHQHWQRKTIWITGDPSENKRNVIDSEKRNAFMILLDELGLPHAHYDRAPYTLNADDRVLFNSLLDKHPEVLFAPHLKNTIQDLKFVKVDRRGEIIKKNRKDQSQRADLLDAVKYSFNTYDSDWVRRK